MRPNMIAVATGFRDIAVKDPTIHGTETEKLAQVFNRLSPEHLEFLNITDVSQWEIIKEYLETHY
jgi:hypothetical protein